MIVERVEAATLTHRNGAWLISWDDGNNDATPAEMYDCASSLTVAKRIAVEGAREQFDFVGAPRWHESSPGRWRLDMRRDEPAGEVSW